MPALTFAAVVSGNGKIQVDTELTQSLRPVCNVQTIIIFQKQKNIDMIRNLIHWTLAALMVTALGAGRLAAQTPGLKSEMVSAAQLIDTKTAMLLPAVQKVRDAAARAFWTDYFTQSQTIARNVIRAGVQMTDEQYRKFENDFISANKPLQKVDCKSPTGELDQTVCRCMAQGNGSGHELSKCIADSMPNP